MSRFRAINRSSESLVEPTHERPLSDVVSRQTCETNRGQASASNPKQQRQYYTTRPGAVVTPQIVQGRSKPEGKTSIKQAVERSRKAERTSKKRKKREAGSSVSKPRRQQAHREKKLVYSIEHSSRKTTASSTPERGTDGDYIPSPADLARITLSSPSSTPSRRSPRKYSSRCPNAGSSALPRSTLDGSPSKILPQDGGTLAITKRENSPNLEASSPSPLIWSTPVRQKRYEEDNFAELPREVFEYLQTKKQLAIKKEIMMAGKRKEKGKLAEERPVREMQGSTQKMNKRRAEGVVEDSERRKRPKSQKSQEHSTEAHSTANDCKILGTEPEASKPISPRRSFKGKTMKKRAPRYETVAVKAEDRFDITDVRSHMHSHADIKVRSRSSKEFQNGKVQRSFRAGAEAQDYRRHDQRPGQSNGQASRSCRQQKKSSNEGWCKAYKRREVILPRSCSCLNLHKYFTRDPSRVPSLETFPEDEAEYFENLKQILNCRGSLHTLHVVDVCKRMLKDKEKQKRQDNDSPESNLEPAQGILTTDGQNNTNLRRAQSSIAPWDFYGNPTDAGSSSSSESEVRRVTPSLESRSISRPVSQPTGVISKGSPSKSLPMRDRRKNATCLATAPARRCPSPSVVINSSQSLTRPIPSPLAQRRSVLHTSDSAPCGQENVGARPVSKSPLPEAPSRLNQSLISFSAQRRRHQSAPVDMHRRDNTVNQPRPLPLPAQQKHDNALREISSNATLQDLNRTIASLRDLIERFPAAPQIQIAAAQPVPAPAPAPVPVPGPNAPNGNQGGQPPARGERRKRPSVAEQKLTKPELDRNVPMHLRLDDDGIVRIGRIADGYERHKGAPYAFNWYGYLYRDYDHLLVMTVDGATVWTAKQIRRLQR